MGSLAARYEDGDRRGVWDDLVALGPAVFEPAWQADGEEVARLTMERVAANVATLTVKLTAMGYRFGGRFDRNRRRRTIEDLGLRDSLEAAGRDVSWVDAGDVEETVMGWTGPTEGALAELERAERTVGPLPMSFRAFVQQVDHVDLSGSFPSWDPSAYAFDDGSEWPDHGLHSDPLNFNGIEMVLENFKPSPQLLDPTAEKHERSYPMPIAANHVLSANRPGDFHYIHLPDACADPMLEGVYNRPGIRLVEYLRVAFEWGGFPGFEFSEGPPAEIDVLRRGLLPI